MSIQWVAYDICLMKRVVLWGCAVIKIENRDKFLLLLLAFMSIANVLDIVMDLSHNLPLSHVSKEVVMFLLSLIGFLWLINGYRIQQREVSGLRLALDAAKQQAIKHPPKQYVIDARKRLGDVISQQFDEWLLTPSEKEVGLMLLKGLSLKEIAALRETLEKTVRQQASSIYKKASINGRHAFSAWFIEDIL
jgi:DNA-binding CsgD family transcriptional regulator